MPADANGARRHFRLGGCRVFSVVVLLMCCNHWAEAEEMMHFSDNDCKKLEATNSLPSFASWVGSQCISPISSISGSSWIKSLSVKCQADGFFLKAHAVIGCTAVSEDTKLSREEMVGLLAGKCTKFQPTKSYAQTFSLMFRGTLSIEQICSTTTTTVFSLGTMLIDNAKAGDTKLHVASTLNFQIGDIIIVGGKEKRQIVRFDELTLDVPLQHNYPSRTSVEVASMAEAASYRMVVPSTTEPMRVAPTSKKPPRINATRSQTRAETRIAESTTQQLQSNIVRNNFVRPIDNEDPVRLPCVALDNLTYGGDSPLRVYIREFHKWLEKPKHQETIAIGGLVVGLFLAWDGPAIWRSLFTLVVAGAGAAVMRFEEQTFFHLTEQSQEWILFAETGLAIAFAVNISFDGSQTVLGVILGVWGTYKLLSIGFSLPFPPLIWYSCGGVLGMCAILSFRRPVLAVLSPLLGGLLIASSLGFWISQGLASLAAKQHPIPQDLILLQGFFPPENEAWISSCRSLFGKRDPFVDIAIQCVWSLLGIALYHFFKSRALAVIIVALGIILSATWGLMSLGCKPLALSCPETAPWKWLISGSVLWIIAAALSLIRHLGILARLGIDSRVLINMRRLQQANALWRNDWGSLNQDQKEAAARLGWTDRFAFSQTRELTWQNMKVEQREAARMFGWNEASWDSALWLEDGNPDSACRGPLLSEYTGYTRCQS